MPISAFEKFQIRIFDPKDEKFDPDQHEAMSMQDSKDPPSGHVIAVIQKDCELNGRLVRPAMVVVAK